MKLRTALLIATAAAGLGAALPANAGHFQPAERFVIARGGDDGAGNGRWEEDRRGKRRDERLEDEGRGRSFGYGYERRHRETAGEAEDPNQNGRKDRRQDRRDERRERR